MGGPGGARAVRHRGRGGDAAAAQGAGPRRDAAARRGRRVRPVRLRRHARHPHGGHRHHRRAGVGALQRRHSRLVCLRRPRARATSVRIATSLPGRSGSSRFSRPSCQKPSHGCRARLASCGSSRARWPSSWPRTRRRRSPGTRAAGGTAWCAAPSRARRRRAQVLAQAIVTRPGHVVALVARPAGLVVVARSADVALNAAQVVKALMGRFGGKGGGRPEGAQAGGLDADAGGGVCSRLTSSFGRRVAALVVGLAIDLGCLLQLVDVPLLGLQQRLHLERRGTERTPLSRGEPVVDPAAQFAPAEKPVEQESQHERDTPVPRPAGIQSRTRYQAR